MRNVAVAALVAVLALSAAAPAVAAAPAARPAAATAQRASMLLAFRGHFGGFGARSRGFGTRPRHSFLRRAAKTAIWLYILHLFFSHGGLSILLWIVIIALVVALLHRRRRRYAY